MRAERDQAKTARGNLQLCSGLKAGIESETYAIGKRWLERVRAIQRVAEEEGTEEGEVENGGVSGLLNNSTI